MNDIGSDEGGTVQAGMGEVATSRRNVLLGATSIAAATAAVASLGAGRAAAAPSAAGISCTLPSIGTFVSTSFQFGAGLGVSSAAGGVRQASAPSISEIVLTKATDGTSIGLLSALLRGIEIDPVTITFPAFRGGPAISMVLRRVIISGWSPSSGGDVPSESVSLNFTEFQLTVDGASVSYDMTDNTVG